MTKTPQFDRAIQEYFNNLKLDEKGGLFRICRFTGEEFYIRPEDVSFCKEMKVPLPTISSYERIRLKFAYTNSQNLFKVKSSLTGKEIISEYTPSTRFKIYEHQEWYGEGWDPFEFGVEYDMNKSFFGQYAEFQRNVPRPNLRLDKTSVNSDYSHASSYLKNCYLTFDSISSQDCMYGIGFLCSRDCVDGMTVFNSQECYDCFESRHLYRCRHMEFAENCLNSAFLYDCRDCTSCFMSANLRHKKYVFYNQQLSKAEYEKKMTEINLGNRDVLNKLKEDFEDVKNKAFNKENHNENSQNCYGDYMKDSKNCYGGFYAVNCDNVAYSFGSINVKDTSGTDGGSGSTRIYESYGGQGNNNIKFSLRNLQSHDLEYCDQCQNCSDCFACTGLKNKSFCIFNVQYTEDEYWKKLDEIKVSMLKSGEYGEFFPPELSLVPYNISSAFSYEGFHDIENARKYGYPVEELKEYNADFEGEYIKSSMLPADIKDVGDDILQKVIFDEVSKKKFKIHPAELDFYRRFNIPIPTEHYSERIARFRKKIGSVVLRYYDRKCDKCKKDIKAVYPPESPKIVYCEKDYYDSL